MAGGAACAQARFDDGALRDGGYPGQPMARLLPNVQALQREGKGLHREEIGA